MDDTHVVPFRRQVLGYQPSVAVFRRRLAAKQDRRHVEPSPVDQVLNLALAEQGQKPPLVFLPGDGLLLVAVQEVLVGGKDGQMMILCPADLVEEVFQVGALGKGGELGGVVQPDVDQAPDSGPLEELEEFGGAFPGETDCVDFHDSGSSRSNSVIWPLVLRKVSSLASASSLWR